VKKINLMLLLYISSVFLIGLILAIYIVIQYENISVLGVVLFGLLICAAENLSVPLPKTGSVSVNFGISLASLILFGLPTAIIVTFISVFNIREVIKREPYYKHLFNSGQYLISICLSGLLFETLYIRNFDIFFTARNIGVIILTAFIFFIANTILTAVAISLNNKISFINIWVFNFAWLIPFQIFLAVMAIAISFLYNQYGPFTLMFTLLPLIIAQYTYLLRVKERRTLLNSVIQIVRIVEAKDIYTAGHSVRVADYCEKIARKLRLSENDIEIMRHLANLHDIGKVQVELSTLNKIGPLNEEDWIEIKRHPEVGYSIIKEITFLKDNSNAVLYHHERIDGSGYPEGIKGDKIPLFSKILAVADSYDAMTTDRPYRKALDLNESIDEIEKNKGTQFDEKIADFFIDILKNEKD
jgi:putative nucleotidyltransferase with HDIG domain